VASKYAAQGKYLSGLDINVIYTLSSKKEVKSPTLIAGPLRHILLVSLLL